MDVANRLFASPAVPIDTKTAFDAVSVAVVALRAYQGAHYLYTHVNEINILGPVFLHRQDMHPVPRIHRDRGYNL